jgi:hypothetical protein
VQGRRPCTGVFNTLTPSSLDVDFRFTRPGIGLDRPFDLRCRACYASGHTAGPARELDFADGRSSRKRNLPWVGDPNPGTPRDARTRMGLKQ